MCLLDENKLTFQAMENESSVIKFSCRLYSTSLKTEIDKIECKLIILIYQIIELISIMQSR